MATNDKCVVVHIKQKNFSEEKAKKFLIENFEAIGGKISKLNYLRYSGLVYIYYEKHEDARKILDNRKKTIKIKKSKGQEGEWTFNCQPFKTYPPKNIEDLPCKPYEVDLNKFNLDQRLVVHIKNKDFDQSEDYLKDIFSNKQITGGGPIRRLELLLEKKICLIDFEEKEVVQRLVKKKLKIEFEKGKYYKFNCAGYKFEKTETKKLVEKFDMRQKINERIFEKRFMKHFLLIECRQASLYWTKAYSDLK